MRRGAKGAGEAGTFVTRAARVKRYFQAKPAPGMARPAWWVFSGLAMAAGRGERVASADEAFDRLSASVDGLRGLVPV